MNSAELRPLLAAFAFDALRLFSPDALEITRRYVAAGFTPAQVESYLLESWAATPQLARYCRFAADYLLKFKQAQ